MPVPVQREPRPAVRLLCGLLVLCGSASMGCAAFRHKSPCSEADALCRQYSREGISALETGDYSEAETLLRQATGASPTDADARRHLAETLWARGEAAEALNQMQAAVELDASDPHACVRYGEMLLASGDADGAIEQARTALAINPRVASAWALRGRSHWQLGDHERGLGDLHQALRRDPESRDVLADMAAIYFQTGRRQRELMTLHMLRKTYVPGEEPTELLTGEAEAYLALGRPLQAVERLRLACERSAPTAPMLYRLAEAEAAAGDASQARATAARALDAGHPGAQALVARLNSAERR